MAPSPISPATSGFRNKRLSVIAEDGSTNPPRNQRGKPLSPAQSPPYTPSLTSHRPESRQWMDKPPHHSADQSPPGYQHWNEETPPSTRQRWVEKVRSNRQITRRGGWKRLLIILIISIILIIALAVGLGVGLSQRNNSPSPGSGNSASENGSSNGNTTTDFPEGSWIIAISSTNTTASCTSNSNTWSCSVSQYEWTITPDDSPSSFSISAQAFPFNPSFNPIPLTLMNKGTSEEYYGFNNISVPKAVLSTGLITSSNRQTICYYNDTVLSAQLYTNKFIPNTTSSTDQSTNAGSNPEPTTSGSPWKAFSHRAVITETATGGENVPKCYFTNGDGQAGDAISPGLAANAPDTTCKCAYQNFDP